MTATFTAAAAVVLAILGVFLHARLAHQLDASIDTALRQRLRDVSSLIAKDPNASLETLGTTPTERRPPSDITQLLTKDGTVVATEGAPDEPLIDVAQHSDDVVQRRAPGERQRLALVSGTVGDRIVVVGADLHQRDEAIGELDGLLLIGLPAALVLAALAGAWASRTALVPVDRMRRRADAIGVTSLDQRLPEPDARDELQRLARTLNTMLDRLQDGYARERAFVDDAAHELRTPLTILRAELELAASRPRSAEDLGATVESARTQTERLVTLANDLLVLARSAHGDLTLNQESLEVSHLLRGAVERARTLPRGADVSVTHGSSEMVVMADRLRIEQALDNLVANALQHGTGHVALGATSDGHSVTLTVDDDGPPVDPDLAARAFDRFARGDQARTGTGTGLGLAIVAAIGAAHRGAVGLELSPTGGTRAWLRLPSARSNPAHTNGPDIRGN
ncbi:ATP-binding protein [Solirubrobacter soli]|uniref:ATP-binding protein n=1 Tax=Solirubrobacter soli TaxID=363832 RepID=UPI0004075407|nr:ATP-binding protein [Solirubrobacter soli]